MAESNPGGWDDNAEGQASFNKDKRVQELKRLWNKVVENDDLIQQADALIKWLESVRNDIASFTDLETEVRSGYMHLVQKKSEDILKVYRAYASATQGQPNRVNELDAALYKIANVKGTRLIEWM